MKKEGTAWAGKVTSNFGYRTHPVTGEKNSYHGGMDIGNPNGTKVTANITGKVIASGDAKKNGYDSSYGNIVVVQDGSGNKHIYAHLSSANAKIGSTVQTGALLGAVGSTGRSTGNHLHYEVKSGGKSVDPRRYIG